MTRVGMVAGEASGDLLAAGLITAIKEKIPDAEFVGIAGPEMTAAGCRALYPSEKLSVMGLAEVVRHLPELLRIRRELTEYFLVHPPDVFVGVDAPDFNLTLERRLRARGIQTVHYVSPSVWAWRQKRVRKIARSVDLMLTLFPFEAAFYQEHQVPVRFVGHPLADLIPMETDRREARRELGLDENATLVALLPGSRRSEVKRLAAPFVQAAARCAGTRPEIQFVVPAASERIRRVIEQTVAREAEQLPIQVLDGQSRAVMACADAVLVASGTAALEAMLLKRPMVVAYRVAPITYWTLKLLRVMKVSQFSLPNLLAGRGVVTELIQEQATPQRLADELMYLLDHPQASARLEQTFARIHATLRRDASAEAAQAIVNLLTERKRAADS